MNSMPLSNWSDGFLIVRWLRLLQAIFLALEKSGA
jgi:hypothetical protein